MINNGILPGAQKINIGVARTRGRAVVVEMEGGDKNNLRATVGKAEGSDTIKGKRQW